MFHYVCLLVLFGGMVTATSGMTLSTSTTSALLFVTKHANQSNITEKPDIIINLNDTAKSKESSMIKDDKNETKETPQSTTYFMNKASQLKGSTTAIPTTSTIAETIQQSSVPQTSFSGAATTSAVSPETFSIETSENTAEVTDVTSETTPHEPSSNESITVPTTSESLTVTSGSTTSTFESTAANSESSNATFESTSTYESTTANSESTESSTEFTATSFESTAASSESTEANSESTAANSESTAAYSESTAVNSESTAASSESSTARSEPATASSDSTSITSETPTTYEGTTLGYTPGSSHTNVGLVLGFTLPVLVLLGGVLAAVIYQRKKKSGPGYESLDDDFGAFAGLHNASYDVDL